MPQFSDSRTRAVSIVVQRSRLAGNHRAYVAFGPTDVGYRDLDSGAVVCADDADVVLVAKLTAHLVPPALRAVARPTPAPTPAPAPMTPPAPTTTAATTAATTAMAVEHTVRPVHAGPLTPAITGSPATTGLSAITELPGLAELPGVADQPRAADLAELAATIYAAPPSMSARESLPSIRAGRLQHAG